MKKKSLVVSTLLFIGSLALIFIGFMFIFTSMRSLTGVTGELAYDSRTYYLTGLTAIEDVTLGAWCSAVISNIGNLFNGVDLYFSVMDDTTISFIILAAIALIILIIQIVSFVKSKKGSMFLWLLFDAGLVFTLLVALVFIRTYHGNPVELGSAFFTNSYIWSVFQDGSTLLKIVVVIFLLGAALYIIMTVVMLILIPVYAILTPRVKTETAPEAIEETAPEARPYQQIPVYGGEGTVNNINTVGATSPLVVQYFNNCPPMGPAPDGYRCPPPCPCPCEEEHEPEHECECECDCDCDCGLNEDEVKDIVDERLNELVGDKFDGDDYELVYETEDGEEVEYVDFDDIKSIIKKEVEAALEDLMPLRAAEPVKEEPKVEEKPVEPVEAIVEDEKDEEEPLVATPVATDEAGKIATVAPIIVAVPADAVEEDITEAVEEALGHTEPETEELTEDEIRSLVGEELRELLKELPRPVKKKVTHKIITQQVVAGEVTTEVKAEEPVEETPAETVSEAPVEEPKVEEAPTEPIVEEKIEETVVEPVVVEVKAPQTVVEEENFVDPFAQTKAEAKAEPAIAQPEVRGKESTIEKGEIINLNFYERIAQGDETLRNNYNALKGLLMSYGLKDRLSNTGDTFKLSKATYAKITCQGDSLKIYLALDPKDYLGTSIPVQDVSNKSAYKEIPLALKVRSDLSLRRANELIQSCMLKAGLEAKEGFEPIDYVEEVKAALATKEAK